MVKHFVLFGRYYTIRERPTVGSRSIMEDIPMNESVEGALLGLPECQTELDVRKVIPFHLIYVLTECISMLQ